MANGSFCTLCRQAGRQCRKLLGEREAPDGLLLDDPAFRVWGVALEHGAIPVLAYALEQRPKFNVRKERLMARNLAPGPWLAELKHRIAAEERDKLIQLPDGSSAAAGSLADELLRITPAQKLAYATDLSDNQTNRARLALLARRAHTLFCEAAFNEADKEYAERSGHLTSRGCGEIAMAAKVERLVPFHLSRRYEANPLQIYDEVRSVCQRVVLPKASQLKP